MKYVLGTAQFGLEYGISNTSGSVSQEELFKIFDYGFNHGVQYLDTANAYGNSEWRIGELFQLTKKFQIITKTAHTKLTNTASENIALINNELKESLQKMKRSSVETLLIHNINDITGPSGELFFEALERIKASGLTKKIGVSVYTVEEAKMVSDRYTIDVLQFPLNVFDQNFQRSGILKTLKLKGIELHARSVYLQGLLLMQDKNPHVYFSSIKPIILEYFSFIQSLGLNEVEAALNYLKQVQELDAVVFGVQNSDQLAQTLSSLSAPPVPIDYTKFAIFDHNITNPSLWQI